MSTSSGAGSAKTPATAVVSDSGKFVEYDRFIDSTLRKTRTQVRNVDIATSLMLLGTGMLAFFLLVALADHWIVPGGLGPVLRWSALVVLLVGAAVYCWRTLVPLVLRRINPVYAAHSIERSKPGLKNSLVNFLLLRANPAGLTRNVFEAIEEQAATNLATVPVEATVDRSKLIKIGYVFLAVLLVSAIYKVVSPKDPLRTVGRVVIPWADIDPPTRVRILAVQPGNATVLRGQSVPVTVEVQGLPAGEPVTLTYSTADGQLVGRAVPMRLESGGYLYECQLPEGKDGVQQDLAYQVAAGDAASHTFRLEVQAAPTIVVESIDYRYPQYTGLVNQTVEHQSDIKAIEGTQVTIRAVANQPIKIARLDLDCNGSDDQLMTTKDREASVTFTLALMEDRKTPTHTSYQLTFTNTDGQECPQPIRHQIEVTPDVAPEIEFLAPRKDEVEVPLNAALALEISASDPDYALARVALAGSLAGRPIFEQSLLDEIRSGQLNSKPRISPKKLGLKAGDVLDYWAWAEDSKSPRPNHTETPHRRIKVVSPGNAPNDRDDLVLNDDEKPTPQNRQRPQQKRRQQNPQQGGEQPDQQQDQGGKNGEQADQNGEQGAGQENQQGGQENQQRGGQKKQDQPGAGQQGDKSQQGDQQGDQKQGEQGQDQQGEQGQAGNEKQGQQKQGDQGGQDQNGQQGAGGQDGGQQQAGNQAGQGQGGQQQGGGQGSKQQGGQQGGQEQKQDSGPVAKDGSQDGEAFDKILKRQQDEAKPLKPQDNSQSTGQSKGGDQTKQAQGSQDSGGKPQPAGQGNKPAEPSNEKGPQGQQSEAGEGGNDSGEQAKSGPKGKPTGSKPGGNASGDQNDQPGAPTGEPDANRGAKPQPSQAGDDSLNDKGDAYNGPADPNSGKSQAKGGSKPQGDQQSNSPDKSGGQQQGGNPQGDTSAQGSAPKRNSGTPGKKNDQQPEGQPGESAGGEQQQQGPAGAGRNDQNKPPGTSEAQGTNKPRNKQPGNEKGGQKKAGTEPSSPSGSNHESNAKGQSAGDQSGAGGDGGGQKGSQPGTGGDGQNSASDEGGGTSNERGAGDVADRPGQNREAQGKTGQSGNKPGKGSASQAAPGKTDEQGGEPDQAGGEQGTDAEKSDAKAGGKEPGSPGGDASGVPRGTGHDRSGENATPPPAEPERADAANLEFTRKATELALKRLRDQLNRGDVDQKLLDELGWDKDDLDRWVRGYEELYRKAKANGDQAKHARQELDATLRSLGIRPRGTQIGGNLRDDQTHGLKEGRRTRPPAEYAEQYKAYTQGTSRVRPQPADADKR